MISDSKTVSFTNLRRNNGKNINNFCSLKIILCQCERLFSALYLSLSYYPVRVRRRAEGQKVDTVSGSVYSGSLGLVPASHIWTHQLVITRAPNDPSVLNNQGEGPLWNLWLWLDNLVLEHLRILCTLLLRNIQLFLFTFTIFPYKRTFLLQLAQSSVNIFLFGRKWEWNFLHFRTHLDI